MNNDITNFPLSWPLGIPRTPASERKRANFHTRPNQGFGGNRKHSIAEGAEELQTLVKRARGKDLIISTNLRVKNNGLPYSAQRTPDDPGVAAWFLWKGKSPCLPCDKWLTVEDNLWAIVKHLDSMCGQDRWGVGTIDQTFAGYMALPDPNTKQWWEVLNVSQFADNEMIRRAWKDLSIQYHPDRGGDAVLFDQVQKAYKLAMGQIK